MDGENPDAVDLQPVRWFESRIEDCGIICVEIPTLIRDSCRHEQVSRSA